MTYLILEMLFCLLLAFLLGLCLGWWLGRRKSEEQEDAELSAMRDLNRCREDLDRCRQDLAKSRADFEQCQAQLEQCRSDREPRQAVEADSTPAALVDLGPGDSSAEPEPSEAETPPGTGDSSAGPEPSEAEAPEAPLPIAAAVDEPVEPDDLKVVEGVGPKIEGLLNAAGIETWAQLARTEVATLQEVLDAAGPRYRIHDPETWPQQAALAASGSWDELEELQDRLKGGRKR